MRQIRLAVFILLAVSLIFGGTAMAAGGNGKGNMGNGYGQGSGMGYGNGNGYGNGYGKGKGGVYGTSATPCSSILAGTALSLEGTVSGIGSASAQNSLTISAQGGDIEVYGLGPNMYWGAAYPEIGDHVSVDVRALNLNGTTRNIIMELTHEDGTSVRLRDTVTGCPLWRNSTIK